jgi:Response regulators consisting of a CheY-like receiver domain and a winged-helix DNA-binding domain
MSAPGPRVLVVDDEHAIRRLLKIGLGSFGYVVDEAATGREALVCAARSLPDLVVLDLGLPDMDGQEVIRELRVWTRLPIIVLSVRDAEQQKVAALDGGANDYVTKPFSVNELAARVRAALRGRLAAEAPVIVIGEWRIDLAARRVEHRGDSVSLTRKEFALLQVLASHPGRVVTQRQLLDAVWGPGHAEDTHYLRIHIAHLRQKLGDDPAAPRLIATEAGVGYRLLLE